MATKKRNPLEDLLAGVGGFVNDTGRNIGNFVADTNKNVGNFAGDVNRNVANATRQPQQPPRQVQQPQQLRTMPTLRPLPTVTMPSVTTPNFAQPILAPKPMVSAPAPVVKPQAKATNDFSQAPTIETRSKQLQQGINSRQSMDQLSTSTGLTKHEISQYTDKYKPGYGAQNPLEAVGSFVGDTINNAAGIVRKPIVTAMTSTDQNAKQAINNALVGLNDSYKNGMISQAKLQEETNKLVGDQIGSGVVVDQNGIRQGGQQEATKQALRGGFQQGVDTSNVLPAGRLINGVKTTAVDGIAPVIKQVLGTNAKQALVYGTTSTANDVAQGRGITPESLAANYVAPFALGSASELAGVAGQQVTTAIKNNLPSGQAELSARVTAYDAPHTELTNQLTSLPQGSPERLAVAQQIADNRLQRLEAKRSVQSEIGQAGFIQLPGRAKTIHPDDQGIMSDFIDYTRGTYKPDANTAHNLEVDAAGIAEHYGIKMPPTRSGLADQFDQHLIAQADRLRAKRVGQRGSVPASNFDPTGKLGNELPQTKYATVEEAYKAKYGYKPDSADTGQLEAMNPQGYQELMNNVDPSLRQSKAELPATPTLQNKILASKPAEYLFGDKQRVIDARANLNNTVERQTASKNSPMLDQNQNTSPSPAPVEAQLRAGKAEQRPAQPVGQTGTSKSKNQASSEQLSPRKTQQQSAQVGVDQSLGGVRSRGFIETIKNDPNTPQLIKDSVASLYEVRNTKDLQIKAANLVKKNPEMAQRIANSNTGDVSQMVGSELIKHHSAKGNYEQAIALAQEVAKQATEHGRASQALSAYAKLTPEGILRFTQKEINRFNTSNNLAPNKAIKLTPEKAKALTEQSQKLQSMPEGREKDIATQKMLNDVQSILPAGWVKKVSTLQTIGQLLNFKTMTRNVVGNSLFGTMDTVSQVGAAGIDNLTSKILKSERTTALPNLRVQAKGIAKGGKEAFQETTQGVNLGPDTQFDLSEVPVFKSKFMQRIESTLGVSLRVPDRAAYTAAFDDTLHGLMKANKVDAPTQQMLDLAHANGMYRTFQDNSRSAQLFSKMKEALNNVGVEKNGARFGLGDFILKYPKTPGNIISRGLDYSPVGIIKGLYQMVKPAITKQPFDQHTFANSISRGVMGSGGLMGAGAVLGAIGIITEKPSSDADTRNLQKASGQGGYQINTSALVRFFTSGFNKDAANLQPGDTLMSYDWAQPLSIPLSAGAAIGKGQNALDGATSTVENLTSGLNTLVEQPLISGLNTFANNIKNKGVIGAFGETVKSAPASFVPTISNQARQLTDNTARSTYDPNSAKTALNKVINKIPGLASTLPAQVGTLGKDNQNYANNTNNIFNVMVNPAFVTKYNPDAAAKLPLDILAKSGETQQMPTTTATSQKVSGEDIKLTAQQNHDFQQYVGQHTNDYYTQLLGDKAFMAKTDSEKAKIMSGGLSDISKAAKMTVLGDESKSTASQRLIASGESVYKTSSAVGTTKLDTSSSSYTFLDNASVIPSEEKAAWARKEVDPKYKDLVDNINNSLPEGLAKLPTTNAVAELYANYQKAKADGNWSDLQNKKESKKLAVSAYKSQLTDNETFISGLSDKEIVAAADNGDVSKEEIDRIIGIDNILSKLGMTPMIGNKTRSALGYGSLGSSSGSKATSNAALNTKIASIGKIDSTTDSTLKSLQSLLATTRGKSSTPRKLGQKASVKKITIKGTA